MSKSARAGRPKMPFAGSPSASSISGEKPNQGLEAMLHVTHVETSYEDKGKIFYYKRENSQSELSMEVKAPDVEEEVPQDPPFVALVSNLPMECNERELIKVFTNFSIRTLTVPKKGKRPKGFAYVEMNSREELLGVLQMEKLKCRGRLLSIKLCPDPEKVPKGGMSLGDKGIGEVSGFGVEVGAGGDAPFTPLSMSDYDATSGHYAASVSDLSTSETADSPLGSPRLGSQSSIYQSEMPISRKPSSIDELERRMDIRFKKLAEFENAQSEHSSQLDEEYDQEDIFSASWTDILNEIKKTEQL